METPEKPFIITTASCGDARTRIVTARSAVDVKRALLAEEWSPNAEYFYDQLGLPLPEREHAGHPIYDRNQQLFAVLVGVLSGKERFWDLTPRDIGQLDILRHLDYKTTLATLPDHIIEKLFEFAFTGGEGEQRGNPGKEWTTITVEPLVIKAFPSIYEKFDAGKLVSEPVRTEYLSKAGLLPSETDEQVSNESE